MEKEGAAPVLQVYNYQYWNANNFRKLSPQTLIRRREEVGWEKKNQKSKQTPQAWKKWTSYSRTQLKHAANSLPGVQVQQEL